MPLLRRTVRGILCIVFLTLLFHVLNIVSTSRIEDVIGSGLEGFGKDFLAIGQLQTDFLSRIRLRRITLDLTRYSFMSRLSVSEIISDFNIFEFLSGNRDVLENLTVISPQLVLKRGSVREGLIRLFEDLKDTALTQQIEIHSGRLIFESQEGEATFFIKNIWGRVRPLSKDKFEFIFTNQSSSNIKNIVLIKGELEWSGAAGEIFVSLRNFDLGKVLRDEAQSDFAKLMASSDFLITYGDGAENIEVKNLRLHAGKATFLGGGDIYPVKKQTEMDLSLDVSYKDYVGQIALKGDVARPLLRGKLWTGEAGLNKDNIIIKGYVSYSASGGIKLEDMKVESGLGKIAVDGILDMSSFSLDIFIHDKFYNDVKLKGNILCEAEYSRAAAKAFKVYISGLEINGEAYGDVFADIHYENMILTILEARGSHVTMSGEIDFHEDVPRLDLLFSCQDADFSGVKPLFMKGRGSAHLSGNVNGTLSIRGPFNMPGGRGSFVIENGSIGMIPEFKKMTLDFNLNGPIIIIKDARIMRRDDYFVLSDTIDLSRNDVFEGLSIEHVGEGMDGWTIKEAGPKVGLDIFGELGHEISATGGEDKGARESLLEMEYEIKKGEQLFFKMEENESIMGIEKKIEF